MKLLLFIFLCIVSQSHCVHSMKLGTVEKQKRDGSFNVLKHMYMKFNV
jgi:hypothetical protein